MICCSVHATVGVTQQQALDVFLVRPMFNMDDEDNLVSTNEDNNDVPGPLPQLPQLDGMSASSHATGVGDMSEANERYVRHGRPRCDKSRWGVLLHPFGDDDIISRTYSV
jgi:hypothetical protein